MRKCVKIHKTLSGIQSMRVSRRNLWRESGCQWKGFAIYFMSCFGFFNKSIWNPLLLVLLRVGILKCRTRHFLSRSLAQPFNKSQFSLYIDDLSNLYLSKMLPVRGCYLNIIGLLWSVKEQEKKSTLTLFCMSPPQTVGRISFFS